ncbi:MAG: hypothetical protein Q4E69_07150 [Bacilli bacterium]|nr:hypothetical protein [Bacilli bacterium]
MIKLEEFKNAKLLKISLLTENFKEVFIDKKDIVDLYLGNLLEVKYHHQYDEYIVDAIGSYEFKLVLKNDYLDNNEELNKILKLNNLTQLELFFEHNRINLDLPWDIRKDNDELINPSMNIIKDNDTTSIIIKEFDNPTSLNRKEVLDKLKDISKRYSTIRKVELYGDYAIDKVKEDSLLIVGIDVEEEFTFENKELYKFKYDVLNEINKNIEVYLYNDVVKDKFLGSKGLVIK